MNILDTSTALAGEEKRFLGSSLSTTYPTSIRIVVGSVSGFRRGGRGRIEVAWGWRVGVYRRHDVNDRWRDGSAEY